MLEGAKECRFTEMNAKDSVYLSNILRDFEEECGNIYNQELKSKHDISSFVFSLDMEFGFSRISKAYLN